MDTLIHHISAWDRLPLQVRQWHVAPDAEPEVGPGAQPDGGPVPQSNPGLDTRPNAQPNAGSGAHRPAGRHHPPPPILCLPGLVRTGADFETLAAEIGHDRRVVTLDYPGRGDSGRSRDVNRYAPEACLRDVMDVCAALHVHRAVIIGTSFGGLLAMGLAAARPALVHAVVLNDIGPDIAGDGADFVRDFVGHDPALPSLEAGAALLRASLPPMSLHTDAAWRRMAELTYRAGPDGLWHPNWDTAIAQLLNRPPPDLWPIFGALAHLPVLLVRGAVSNILLPGTVSRMQAVHPDMEVVSLPGIGHAPILTEPPALAAIQNFLARNP
ncbi:alpha/beta fold hydrolase [Rhodopila sp.]|uniref:alpha/beta fold hydrolase n=1 Tax=Rhodopila sp. TaxID=2480087 RepID=UPI003D0D35E2